MHLIPIVNIFAHVYKEKGLNNHLPELNAYENADYKCTHLNEQVKALRQQVNAQNIALAQLTKKRSEFLKRPQKKSTGIKGVVEKLQHKYAASQVSTSKIKDLTKERNKVQKNLNFYEEHQIKALATKRDLQVRLKNAAGPGEIQAIKKEKQFYRNTYRVGLAVLTAVSVAAVALSSFAIIPAAIGYGATMLAGVSFGAHISLCKADKWKMDNELSRLQSSLEE